MEESQLRVELEEILANEYRSTFESMRKRQEAEDALTDDEWWAERRRYTIHLDSPAPGELRREMLRLRHSISEYNKAGGLDRLLEKKVNELMPFLLEVREETGVEGPLTQDQYYAASFRMSQAQILWMQAKIESAAKTETQPLRRQILEQLAINVKESLVDMKALLDSANASNENCGEFAEKCTERMKKLRDILRPPE